MSRRILLTGATTGFGIGLIRALLARDDVAEVVAVARPGEACPVAVLDRRFRLVRGDLCRDRDRRSLLWGPGRHCDSLVHAALHRAPHEKGAHRLHVGATRSLLDLAEDHPRLERFVFRSTSDIYRVDGHLASVIDERHELRLSPREPPWVRDRVAADLLVSTRSGLSPLSVTVLRFAPCMAPAIGSQLHDYLSSSVCFVPLGFDPILNVLSLEDMVAATVLAVFAHEGKGHGIFNIPGGDTLALSRAIALAGAAALPLPELALGPLTLLQRRLTGHLFDYSLHRRRFHHNAVLSGVRAEQALGYEPRHRVVWPAGSASPGPIETAPPCPPPASAPGAHSLH